MLTFTEAQVAAIEKKLGKPLAIIGKTKATKKKGRPSQGEECLKQQIRALGLEEPIAEFRFHETRMWRFDFAWVDKRLAVEVEGGVYSGGRHTRGKGFEGDCEKYAEAALDGWTVLRFSTKQVLNCMAIKYIQQALEC